MTDTEIFINEFVDQIRGRKLTNLQAMKIANAVNACWVMPPMQVLPARGRIIVDGGTFNVPKIKDDPSCSN